MRHDAPDLRRIAIARHQRMAHRLQNLADDHQRRIDEQIEHFLDLTLGGVFDRHHAEIGAPVLHLLEDRGERSLRRKLDAAAECAARRLMRVGVLRPEIRHPRHVFERAAGGNNFAIDVRDMLGRERPRIRRDHRLRSPRARAPADIPGAPLLCLMRPISLACDARSESNFRISRLMRSIRTRCDSIESGFHCWLRLLLEKRRRIDALRLLAR